MDTRHFDFVVIGGGSAGYAAARTARGSLEKVAIIDDAGELGGLCILKGCMPSKTLIYSSELLHLAQQGDKFGLDITSATMDMAALSKRKRVIIEEFASYRRGQLGSDRFTLIRDRASFTDERTLVLANSGERITADFFMIATGSVVNTPDIPGLRETPHWTSDDVLDLDFLPESVIVLGGGIVACELAQYLRRVGSRVVQIQRGDRILRDSSPEASAVVSRVFLDEGIELHTGTSINSVRNDGGGISVEFSQGGQDFQVHADHLLNALGRRPNVEGLALDKAGVELLESGSIRVNDMQQTTNPRVYAGGDVASPHEIVHLAVMQGEVAAKHACGKDPEPVNYDTVTTV
ncbi:MAG: NAD(P)/FAD-dependent oxidoreductase, partial [Verrucomicrobiaceae bacterium]